MIKNVAFYASLILFAIVALGALRTVVDTKWPFLRKWETEARAAYIALTIAGVALFAWAVLDLRIQSVEIAGVKATVGELQKKVDTLADQMKAFFARKVIETFDEHNWNRVRKVRTSGANVILEVTLKQDPLPGSIEVFEGPVPMPEQYYHLAGRRLQFLANTDKPISGLTIKYYPDLGESSEPKSR